MTLDIVQLIKVTLECFILLLDFLEDSTFFTYLSSVLFKDRRSAILLGGLVVNDLLVSQ